MDTSSLVEFVHCSIACISAVRAWNANRKRYLTPCKNHPIVAIHMPHRVGSLKLNLLAHPHKARKWKHLVELQKGVSVQKIFTRVPSKVSSAKIRLSLGREDTQFPGMPPPPTSMSPTTTTTTATTSTTISTTATTSLSTHARETSASVWRRSFLLRRQLPRHFSDGHFTKKISGRSECLPLPSGCRECSS